MVLVLQHGLVKYNAWEKAKVLRIFFKYPFFLLFCVAQRASTNSRV